MTSHPRENYTERRQGISGKSFEEYREGLIGELQKRGMSRRDVLKAAGAGAGALGLGSVLAACGSSSPGAAGSTGSTGSSPTTTATGAGGIPLPRPNHPVRWPIASGNEAIASGLKPETGATLQLYNWVAYINEAVVKNFEKKYKCKVQVTTFETMSDALTKLHSGEVDFDVFIPTIDVLGPLIESKLMRPLNHSYIPNIAQAWPDFRNPFYDQGWQYTVPYTIYTTGMTWRKDHVARQYWPDRLANGYSMPWNPKYRGKVAILDDYREGLCLGLLKNGVYNMNTTNVAQLTASLNSLEQLNNDVKIQIDNNDYTNVPDGKIWIHSAWSGDMAAALSYMPKGVSVDVIGYWFPKDLRGPCNNDTMAVLSTAKSPVLAHLFLNYFLDLHNAVENTSWNGYMQPIKGMTPARLVADGILPKSLMSTVVLPSYFRHGLYELELPAATDAVWEQDWQQFSGGL
ncbi:MAG: extracellular solute-binding protein [Acidimicrobiales bacterium]